MTHAPAAIIAVMIVVTGVAIAVGGGMILRRLSEPLPPDDADDRLRAEYADKPSYRSLARPSFLLTAALVGAAASAVAGVTVPASAIGCWWVLSAVGVLLAAVDAATTWLPSTLIYGGWVAMGLATVLTVVLDDAGLSRLITILGSAVIAGVGYLLLWRLTGGRAIAFGDVRLMPMIGATAGTLGWSGLYWSILLGSLIGAVIGIIRLVLHRRGPFPYAPALVAGPYAAAVLLAVLR